MTIFKYYVFTDKIDNDDNGDEQVSVYSQIVRSDEKLTPDQIIDFAESNADWKIQFGEGDESLVDTYVIEEFDTISGETTVIADKYSPN
jgi:hypothetical protein